MEDFGESNQVRLDKWLWVARLYKTRVLAQSAIVSGKIRYNQQRAKPCNLVEVGAIIKIQQQSRQKTIIVKSLSEKRYPLQAATKLYEETESDLSASVLTKENTKPPTTHLSGLYPPITSSYNEEED